jgi:hypothetical protein
MLLDLTWEAMSLILLGEWGKKSVEVLYEGHIAELQYQFNSSVQHFLATTKISEGTSVGNTTSRWL